ncbi:MAG: autotransporter outer membrane beta-barrel domain-containing protein [Alphaproteobacteria bacterium]|nr:autotransporter outer membrane beta-barrel domain-containing protein [Alphaproteobacteria bacterium]
MRKISVVLCLWCTCMFGAVADSFMGDEFSAVVNLTMDSVVYENVLFQPGGVNVDDNIDFINNGRVHSTFSVCDGCEIFIYNRGDFVADFDLGNNARVVQVVSNATEWNPIETDVKYTLVIDGVKNFGTNGVFNGGALENVILKDSVLRMSDIDFVDGTQVYLRGDIVFIVDDLSGLYDGPIMDNVSGDGRVRIQNNSANPLYADVGYLLDGQLFVKRVRETDYRKIFNNDMGVFLNGLRDKNSDDGLLRALDVATDMDSIHDIMARSVRMNRDLLLRSVRVLGEFNKFSSDIRTGVGANFDVVFSDNFYSYDVGARFEGDFDRLRIGLGLHFGNVEYESDLDVFNGVYYGLNLGVDYLMKNNLFMRGMANVLRVDFDMGDVFYNGEIINNPSAVYVGGVADFGYRCEFADSFYVAPFAGLDVVGTVVADISDIDVRGRAGADAGYVYQMLGISYDYGVGININSDNEIMANARVGVWSEHDGAGANIGFAVSHMFDIYSYKISIGGRVWF